MGAGEVPPDADPAVRTEIVHQSVRTRITRLSLPGQTLIRKEPLGPDAERRLRHELMMLERLHGLTGVAQLAEAPSHAGSIVLRDAGSASLADRTGPLPAAELTALAVALALAVAGMHRRGVMHRDITPANIVISRGGATCLVDFALAAPLGEIRPQFTPPSEIAGTLAYLAPEATGRTARPVDQRADLYALGAVLYELATGRPPFGTGDPLRLTHDHLARVPVPPAEVNPAIPALLSAVIVQLLEKEPDHRYQSADGVLYDLEQVLRTQPGPAAPIRIGEHDVPLRLLPPSRLAARVSELAALEEAFEDALTGRCRMVLVAGVAGVGKTALTDQLRPVVTGRDGWFVAGKFDQYRRDLEFEAVYQAFRALGRLLLAEPEDELTRVRERILAELGANSGLATATVPELAALLGAPPAPGDPLTAAGRAHQAGAAVLRAVASRKRPVVMLVDDLQWGPQATVGFIDHLLSEDPIEGLLLVGAYRDGEVDPAHPLAAPLARWRDQAGVRQLRLDNLRVSGSVTMMAEMLHAPPAAAAALAEMIEAHTSGNPLQTVELLDALHGDGLLTATARGWQWDAAAVRAHLGTSEAAGGRAARDEVLPAPSRQLVQAMACLGGRAELSLLQAATGQPEGAVDQALAPAISEGLLVAEPGSQPAVRFRHGRIREVTLGGLDPPRRRAMQLGMARRLAAVPDLFAVAAQQYLPVVDAVGDPAERRAVAALLRRSADQATLIGDHGLVIALLAAAVRLIPPGETGTLVAVHTARHAALFSLGRMEEADEEYRTIERLSPSVLDATDATLVQLHSLTYRNRFPEAVSLGVESLRKLGITVPAPDRLPAQLDRQFGHLYHWLEQTEATADLVRPDITDPALLAATRLIKGTLPAAYILTDHATFSWLSLEAVRIWVEHGPGRSLAGPASQAAAAALVRGDYAAGYRAARRILAFCEARGYEPETSLARYWFSLGCCWFEPIESALHAIRQAREGLVAGADLVHAGYTHEESVYYELDCAPSLDDYAAEAEAGLAFARRTGDEYLGKVLDPYRWLAGALRGESTAAPGHPASADSLVGNPIAVFYVHYTRAIAAAIFGDSAGLAQHSAAAEQLMVAVAGTYPTAVVHLLRGLILAGQARDSNGDERRDLLANLDEVTRWLATRAADAPENFRHLLRLVEAEQAWVDGDFHAAAVAFDAARRDAAGRQRPWHRMLITERAAQFHLAHGLDQAGYDLLAQVRQDYAAWGAWAKAAQLDWAYPILRPAAGATAAPAAGRPAGLAHGRSPVTTGAIDLLGVLSASQALSSETSIERLHARVARVLSAMTGATGVHLLLWSEDRHDWLLPAPGGDISPVSGASHEAAVPMSVLRYAQRTGEPLVADDAAHDERFARDPYFTDVGCCALLALPILNRGALRAVLLLENRFIRGAFTSDRLGTVQLIAGQLAVSLDNAQLYAELSASRARIVATADQTRRRIERDLHDSIQQRLVSLALQLRAVQAAAPPEADALAQQVGDMAAGLAGALEELNEIAHGLHPAILANRGLRPALRALARRSAIPVRLDVQVAGRLPESAEIAAYYAVSEALTNTIKHAQASAVDVEATASDGVLRIKVSDNGRGGAAFGPGSGLIGLKDRIEAASGRITVHSPPGAGTTVQITLPLNDLSRPGTAPAAVSSDDVGQGSTGDQGLQPGW